MKANHVATNRRLVLFRLLFRTSHARERSLIAFAALLSAANGVGFPLLPVLFSRIVANFSELYNPSLSELSVSSSTVAADKITSEIQHVSRLMLVFGAAAALSTFVLAWIQIRTARQISTRIRRMYFAALMRQDLSWYSKNTSGNLAASVTSIDSIEQAMGQTFAEAIRDAFATVAGFALAFSNSWKMTLIVFSFIPVIAIVGATVSILVNRESTAVQKSLGHASSIAQETLSSIRTVLAFEGQDTEKKLFWRATDDLYKRQVRKSVIAAFGTGFLMLVLMCTFSVGFIFGTRLVRSGEVTLPRAIAASAVVPSVFAAFRLANAQKKFAAASAAANEVLEIVSRKPEIDPLSEVGSKPENFRGGISFDNVSFLYDGNKDKTSARVINDFSLEMKPGSSHGLCGFSGSGKSTIVSLLQRFYDVSEGQILLDGSHDIRNVNVRWLRSQIGHVGQMPTLFQGSIRENIEMGVANEDVYTELSDESQHDERNVPLEDVISAAKTANAHDFIQNLPYGYDTQVGEGGAQLSGGQKQRICIARALIRNPKILLLDESTASLDNKSEAIVQEAIEKASQNRTTLIVAHRMETIRRCEKIIVLSNGSIVESGTHEELFKKDASTYLTLMGNQTSQNNRRSNSTDLFYKNTTDETQLLDKVVDGNDEDGPENVQEILMETSQVNHEVQKFISDSTSSSFSVLENNLYRRVISLQSPEKVYTLIGLIGSVVVGASWPLAAACISELLYLGDESTYSTRLRLWAVLLSCCGLSAFIGIVIQNSFLAISGEKLTCRTRQNFFKAILSQDLSFFDRKENSVGALLVNLNSKSELLKGLSSDLLGTIAVAFVSISIGMILAFIYCWRVALGAVMFMPGIFLSGYSLSRVGLDYNNDQVADSVRVAAEAIHRIHTVFSLGIEQEFIQKYSELIKEKTTKEFRSMILPAFVGAYIAASPFCLFGTTFWIGSYVLRSNKCDLLGVNKATLCIFLGSVLVGELTYSVPDLKRAKQAAIAYFEMIRLEENGKNVRNGAGKSLSIGKAILNVENLEFSYPTRPEVQVLRKLSIDAGAGKMLALVGGSGSGKSTIVALILRFYDKRRGSISIDNSDVLEFDVKELRAQIGIVDQEPGIFNRSIRDNISYGISHDEGSPVLDSDIEAAAKIAEAHDFITALPDGYNTLAGPSGSKLSGGQRQRISLARAVIRKPKILLLDEATSALDSKTEEIVQRSLANFPSTRIVVAHRLSTIRDADVIAVVDNGTIIEQGNHSELLRLKGAYAKLIELQNR